MSLERGVPFKRKLTSYRVDTEVRQLQVSWNSR